MTITSPQSRLSVFAKSAHQAVTLFSWSCTLAALMVNCSSGAIATYTDRTAFHTAAVSALSFESFEGLNPTNSFDIDTIVLAGFTLSTPDGGGFDLSIRNDVAPWGGHATDGRIWVDHQSGTNQRTRFDFNAPINALGLDLIDYGDFGSGQLTFSNDAGDFFVVSMGGLSSDNEQFFGVIGTMNFTRVELTNSVSGEAFGIDAIDYGVAVPEPWTVSLTCPWLAIGYAGLRRKTNR